MSRRLPKPFLTAACVAALLLAGPVLADEVAVFKLTARNGAFEPATLQVPAGKAFKLEIANENSKAIEFESSDLKQEKVIAPGKKTTVNINALKAGEYKYMDEFNQATGQGKIVAQ